MWWKEPLKDYANQRSLDLGKDQTDQVIGHAGLRLNVIIDVMYMM